MGMPFFLKFVKSTTVSHPSSLTGPIIKIGLERFMTDNLVGEKAAASVSH